MRTNRARRMWPIVVLVTVGLFAACDCQIDPEAVSIDCKPTAVPAPDTRIALNCDVTFLVGRTSKSVTAGDTILDPKP